MSQKADSLHDFYEPTLEPIFAFKPAFSFPDGIFSPLDRLLRQKKTASSLLIHGKRSASFYKRFLSDDSEISIENHEHILIRPARIIYDFSKMFQEDVSFLNRRNYPLLQDIHFEMKGDIERLWLHPKADVAKLCCIDTREGDIVIESDVTVGPFSYLRGPLYIGKYSQLNRADINHSRVGMSCRMGGEVSHSLIGDFTNKSHEGFLGHSIVGDWVNLGALSVTSNLKNNYGAVNLIYEDKTYSTDVQKLGSIIGDFVKTSIGTMLNTGTILETGVLLFEGRPHQKYYPPFFWGGRPDQYKLDRFIHDMSVIMARRDEKPSGELIQLIKEKYEKTSG